MTPPGHTFSAVTSEMVFPAHQEAAIWLFYRRGSDICPLSSQWLLSAWQSRINSPLPIIPTFEGNRKTFELLKVKLYRKRPEGKSKLLRVSGRFKLLRVRVNGIGLYYQQLHCESSFSKAMEDCSVSNNQLQPNSLLPVLSKVFKKLAAIHPFTPRSD